MPRCHLACAAEPDPCGEARARNQTKQAERGRRGRLPGGDGDGPDRGRWASAGPNPPGNNGTIKIDDVPFDDHPNNEPHVGCVFQVDFYGYDEGDLDAE